MKKVISLFLSLCILLTVCCAGFGSITVFAVEKIEGSEVTWSFDYQNKTLTFDGKGDIPDYDTYEDKDGKSLIPWAGCDFNTILFGKEITGIGNNAFRKSVGLTAVTIPKTITKLGKEAFSSCIALKSVATESGITSIGESAFAGCTSLSLVELADGLTDIGSYAFYKCSAIKAIKLPDSVKSLGTGAFNSCTSLETFVSPKSLVSIGDRAFYCCEQLKSVTLPESMDYLGSAVFDSCAKLTEITLPSGIQKIANAAFSGCVQLNKVLIPEGIQAIEEDAFSYCTSLKSVRIPYSVKTIGKNALGYGRRGAIVDGFAITGYDSTAAQKYATDNNMGFKSLGNPLAKSGTISATLSWKIDEENCLSFIGNGEIPDYSLYDMPVYINSENEGIFFDGKITKLGAYSLPFDYMTVAVDKSITAIGEKAIGYHFDENGKLIKNENFSIVGYKGTAAEKYAKENGFAFFPIIGEGTCGEKATWKYDAAAKKITVAGNGTANIYADENVIPCFMVEDCAVERVEIAEGITELAEDAFVDIVAREGTITFRVPKSVTAIGDHAIGYAAYYDTNENGDEVIAYEADPNCVIEGYANTAAQKYAKDNNIKFVALKPTEEPPVEKDTAFKLSDKAVICTLDGKTKLIRIYDQNATAEKIMADFVIGKDLTVGKPTEIATGKVLETKCGSEVDEKYTLVLMGDVNGDGKINSADALCVLRHAVSITNLTGSEFAAGDLDANNNVNSADALVILRITVGLDDIGAFYPDKAASEKPTDAQTK